jgi:hypothetical protein
MSVMWPMVSGDRSTSKHISCTSVNPKPHEPYGINVMVLMFVLENKEQTDCQKKSYTRRFGHQRTFSKTSKTSFYIWYKQQASGG